jgi:hypothetical protein
MVVLDCGTALLCFLVVVVGCRGTNEGKGKMYVCVMCVVVNPTNRCLSILDTGELSVQQYSAR